MDKTEKKAAIKQLIIKSLFIIGIAIVVIVLTFAVIKVIPRVFSSFANVGDAVRNPFATSEKLKIEIDNSRVNSGELTIVSWKYEPSENGVYELEYSCVQGLELEMGTSEGNLNISCNNVYHLSPTTQTISLLPKSTHENALLETNLNIRYVNREGNVLVQDSTKLAVVKRAEGDLAGTGTIIETETISTAPAQTTTQTGTDTTTQADVTTETDYTSTTETRATVVRTAPGIADLVIYDVYTIDDVTIVFSVSNTGTAATGPWYFNYAMPDGDVASSPIQPSLRPTEAVRYTLRLEDVPRGDVAIAIDPRNLVRETNILNNIAVIEIRGDGGRQTDTRRNEADLEISNLQTGYISGSRFIESRDVYENDIAAVRFVVTNIGDRETGAWRFEIDNLPYSSQRTFESARQTSLRAGERREIVVEFERPISGTYNMRVDLDPRNDVRETSTRNNYDTTTLRVRR